MPNPEAEAINELTHSRKWPSRTCDHCKIHFMFEGSGAEKTHFSATLCPTRVAQVLADLKQGQDDLKRQIENLVKGNG